MEFKRLKTYLALAAVMGTTLVQAPVTAWAIGPGETGSSVSSSSSGPSQKGPGVSQDSSAEAETPKNPYAWERVNGVYQMEDGSPIDGVYARGIDVSHWQGEIDWRKVAGDDVSFVMLGTRYDGQLDPRFHQNIQGALNNGIQVGAYIYSYATTPEMAAAEADFVLNAVRGYNITYPIVFDVEATVMRSLPREELTAIVNTFCQRIEQAGYQTAIYANEYWLYNLLDMSSIPYDVWVARYGVKYTYSNPYMWQATNTGSIEGINGNVDIDFQFKSSPHGQKASSGGPGVSGPASGSSFGPSPSGSGSGTSGPSAPGSSSGTDTSGSGASGQNTPVQPIAPGQTVMGWVDRDGTWYYYGANNQMVTGWIQDNGDWYYLDFDGSMEKGWTMVSDKWYYMRDNGSMVIGWRQIDGFWYYFQGDGQMATGWLQVDGGVYYLDENGRMKANETFTVDGVQYTAREDGRCN